VTVTPNDRRTGSGPDGSDPGSTASTAAGLGHSLRGMFRYVVPIRRPRLSTAGGGLRRYGPSQGIVPGRAGALHDSKITRP